MLTNPSARSIDGQCLESRARELLAADRRDGGERARRRDGERSIDREDDPELRAGEGARGPASFEVRADLRLHQLSVGILEMDIEMVAPVRLVPVDVDRDRDPDHERGRELRKSEHVPGAAKNVELAVDGLG